MKVNSLNDYVKLPIEIETDEKYVETLEVSFSQFIKWASLYLEQSAGILLGESDEIKTDIISTIKNNCASIRRSLKAYYDGDIVQATTRIHNLLERIIKDDSNNFIKSSIDQSYSTRLISCYTDFYDLDESYYKAMKEKELTFFRARTEYFNDYKEMYHIPLDKRDKVGTERFSIPGIPCLYIGCSAYDIWLEMGRPAYSDFNVSAIKLTEEGKKLQVLNLAITPYVIMGLNTAMHQGGMGAKYGSLIKSVLTIYPLIIASSIRNKNSAGKFRSDYIISHLIMLNIKKLGIDGVAYISKRIEDGREDYAYPQLINIALPAFAASVVNTKYGSICEKIEITKPKNLEEFLSIELDARDRMSKQSYYSFAFDSKTEWDTNSNVFVAGKKVNYRRTVFYSFENSICGQEFYRLE